MNPEIDIDVRRAVRSALARAAYKDGKVRISAAALPGATWLVTTNRGAFAVAPGRAERVLQGWFFGITRHADHIYLFENCGLHDRDACMGRIVRLDWDGKRLVDPRILITGLHGNAHQLKVIDDLLCLVDTDNQRVLRFTLDGEPVDSKTPFPPAPSTDTSGAYLHMNCLAQIGGRTAVMLHNGKADPQRPSELAWLNRDWQVESRQPIAGFQCHDIVPDDQGRLWHTASLSGELICEDGRRLKLSDTHLTRAIAFHDDHILVGLSAFGPRSVRDGLAGHILILDRNGIEIERHTVPAGPADVVTLV